LSADRVFEGLSHETRRRVIKALGEHGPLPYKRLLEVAGVETGVLNYHLGKLKGLVEKQEDGRYALTEEGMLAYKILLYYERGGGASTASTYSVVYALKDVYLCPHKVVSSPEAYSPYSVTPAIMLFLLEYAVTGSIYIAALVALVPLAITTLTAMAIYGVVPRDLKRLALAYPTTLSPLCLIPLLRYVAECLVLPGKPLLLALNAVLAVYIVYNMFFVKETFGLDYAKSFIVSLINSAILIYLLKQLGIALFFSLF